MLLISPFCDLLLVNGRRVVETADLDQFSCLGVCSHVNVVVCHNHKYTAVYEIKSHSIALL